MKNHTILFFCLFFCVISFSVKLWLNSNLKNDVQNIKEKNLRDLEFKTNKNFVQFGIENIGISLRDELLKMDIDNTNVKLATGLPFLFFSRE